MKGKVWWKLEYYYNLMCLIGRYDKIIIINRYCFSYSFDEIVNNILISMIVF